MARHNEKAERESHSIPTTITVITSAVRLTRQKSPEVIPRATCALNQATNCGDSSRKWQTKMKGAKRSARETRLSFGSSLIFITLLSGQSSDGFFSRVLSCFSRAQRDLHRLASARGGLTNVRRRIRRLAVCRAVIDFDRADLLRDRQRPLLQLRAAQA